jgi:hypothetical protein
MSREGLREEEKVSCVLFIVALETAVGASGIKTRGTVYDRSAQIVPTLIT